MGESFSFSPHFQAQIVVLALRIAEHQRGESKLQDVKTLRWKLENEQIELVTSDYPPEEITDVVYYAVQLNAKGSPSELEQVGQQLPREYGDYSQTQIEAATLVKFQLRAAGANTKDKQAERKAIQAAIDEM